MFFALNRDNYALQDYGKSFFFPFNHSKGNSIANMRQKFNYEIFFKFKKSGRGWVGDQLGLGIVSIIKSISIVLLVAIQEKHFESHQQPGKCCQTNEPRFQTIERGTKIENHR